MSIRHTLSAIVAFSGLAYPAILIPAIKILEWLVESMRLTPSHLDPKMDLWTGLVAFFSSPFWQSFLIVFGIAYSLITYIYVDGTKERSFPFKMVIISYILGHIQ